MSKNKLGSGIDALLGDLTEDSDGSDSQLISITLLKANPHQPRKHFDEQALEGLAQSIRQNGILQPVLAELVDGFYFIIAGERRYRAAKLAGLTEIPVITREFTETERMEIALLENIQREDLKPIEEAEAYQKLMDHMGLSQQQLADRLGKSRSAVANSLRLLNLPEVYRQAADEGLISAGHARTLLSVTNPLEQKNLYDKIVAQQLSVRQTEQLAAQSETGLMSQPKNTNAKSKGSEPFLRSIEQELIDFLGGNKVFIKGNTQKGKLEIEYYSSDDLERLIEIIKSNS